MIQPLKFLIFFVTKLKHAALQGKHSQQAWVKALCEMTSRRAVLLTIHQPAEAPKFY
jgi:hypothetical protein